MNILDKVDDFFIKKAWETDAEAGGTLNAVRIRSLRLLYIVMAALRDERLSLRSMSLVYTTLFALVPLLAVSFSVLKAFGVHTRIEIFLYYMLEPLGQKGIELAVRIIEFVENINVGVLGSIGLSLLIYTLISQIQKLENALNMIWNVRVSRSFSQRFSNYMSVLLVGPILIFSALGITATLMSSTLMQKILAIKALGTLSYYIGSLIPYALAAAAFTFIYIFLPNTKVKLRPALWGGILAGVLWKLTGLLFASFIVSSAKYSAVYSGFAVLIFFLLWLYWSWRILLTGARVSVYLQHPELFDPRKSGKREDKRFLERLCLTVMFLIGYNFYHSRKPWNSDSLLEYLGCSGETLQHSLSLLKEKSLIIRSVEEPPEYLPARDTETISVKEVLDSVRLREEEDRGKQIPPIQGIVKIMKQIDSAMSDAVREDSIKSLVLSHKGDI